MSRETVTRVAMGAQSGAAWALHVLAWASLVDVAAALALTPVVRSPLPGVIAAMIALMMLATGGLRAVTR